MKKEKVVIVAYNIHSGGGKTILRKVLNEYNSLSYGTICFCHVNLDLDLNEFEHISFIRISPTFFGRFSAEMLLTRYGKKADKVFCLGNLPPLFLRNKNTTVYIHNRYLVDDHESVQGLPPWTQLRLKIESFWLYFFSKNYYHYEVQTKTMKRLLDNYLGPDYNSSINPILPGLDHFKKIKSTRNGFIYVATCEAHKNHKRLIEAWSLLATQFDQYPKLTLVTNITSHSDLGLFIERSVSNNNLNIEIIRDAQFSDVVEQYQKHQFLIYPSMFESFGLPLYEADFFGCDIIASELEYVHDIVGPKKTFNPKNVEDMASKVNEVLIS